MKLTESDIQELNNLFEISKKKPKKVKNETSMRKKRDEKTWEYQFKISKDIFRALKNSEYSSDLEYIRRYCVGQRNPVVFDNNVESARSNLPYYIPGHGNLVSKKIKNTTRRYSNESGEEMTNDHLVGMSNIVLYIHINKIDERWNSHNDFISTLKSLQVLLPVPKSLNNKGSFKSWQFDINNINECIKWYKKLQIEGITHLCSLTGELVPVMDVYNEWYENNKSFL